MHLTLKVEIPRPPPHTMDNQVHWQSYAHYEDYPVSSATQGYREWGYSADIHIWLMLLSIPIRESTLAFS